MTEPRDSTVTVNGATIHLARAGQGRTLLFLHDARGAGDWPPFLRTLSARFDVIAPEHPGFGRSDTPEWLDTVGDLAFFYLDLMEQLDLRDVHLVGAALGGWIAAELATRNTGRLKTLTLLAPVGILVPDAPIADVFLWNPEQMARNLYADPALAERALAQTPSDEEQDRQFKNALMLAKLAWQPRLHNPHLRKWLHRIDRPTLLIFGEDDRITTTRYGAAYRDLIPNARLELLARCGHLPHLEQAEACATLVAAAAG